MSLKKPWAYEGWEITPSYIVLPTERQTYWCERGKEFRDLRPDRSARSRGEVEALLVEA